MGKVKRRNAILYIGIPFVDSHWIGGLVPLASSPALPIIGLPASKDLLGTYLLTSYQTSSIANRMEI